VRRVLVGLCVLGCVGVSLARCTVGGSETLNRCAQRGRGRRIHARSYVPAFRAGWASAMRTTPAGLSCEPGARRRSDASCGALTPILSLKRGAILDAGAFIAVERRDRVMVHLAQRFADEGTPLVTSAGVVAQVWREGGRAQVPVAFLLRRTTVIDLTHAVARMLGVTRTRDVIDAHVVFLARERGWSIVSSDPDGPRAIDPAAAVHAI
jgi:hypothetical protein